jgi:hypothetical protein
MRVMISPGTALRQAAMLESDVVRLRLSGVIPLLSFYFGGFWQG